MGPVRATRTPLERAPRHGHAHYVRIRTNRDAVGASDCVNPAWRDSAATAARWQLARPQPLLSKATAACFGGIRRVGDDSTLLIVVNSHTDVVSFTLPNAAGGNRWQLLGNGELARVKVGERYEVPGRALLLFVLQPARTPQRATAAERSFQRVVQAVEDASLKSVRFGFD